MEQNRVTLQQAMLLKEVGYDVPCCHVYSNRNREIILNYEESNSENSGNISRPKLNDCCDWLRDVHKIHVYTILSKISKKWGGRVFNISDYSEALGACIFNTHTQALSAGIDAALNHIKNAKDGK